MVIKVIDATIPSKCGQCGKVDDLRPYGPGNIWICYDCAMKDEEGSKARFLEMLNGGGIIHVVAPKEERKDNE